MMDFVPSNKARPIGSIGKDYAFPSGRSRKHAEVLKAKGTTIVNVANEADPPNKSTRAGPVDQDRFYSVKDMLIALLVLLFLTSGFINVFPSFDPLGLGYASNSQQQYDEALYNAVSAAVDGYGDLLRAKEHASLTSDSGFLMSSSSSPLRVMANRLEGSKLPGANERAIALIAMFEIIRTIHRTLNRPFAGLVVKVEGVDREISDIRTSLRKIRSMRSIEPEKDRTKAQLLLRFLDPVHRVYIDPESLLDPQESWSLKNFLEDRKGLHGSVQELLEQSTLAERNLTEYNQYLCDIHVGQGHGDRPRGVEICSGHESSILVDLWTLVSRKQPKSYDSKERKNLHQIEKAGLLALPEVVRCREALESAEAHFRRMRDEYMKVVVFEPNREALDRIIEKIDNFLLITHKEQRAKRKATALELLNES